MKFNLKAPAGATEGQKRAAVARAIFDGELPDGYSWGSHAPISLRNPDLKRGKYKTWQTESFDKTRTTLMRVFRSWYERIGEKVTRSQEKEMYGPMRPAKIPKKARAIAAKKGHKKRKRTERKLSKRKRAILHKTRSLAAIKGWRKRKRRYGKSGRKRKGGGKRGKR